MPENTDRLTHLDAQGNASMVDVGAKGETVREATASAFVAMKESTLNAILDGEIPKGDALATARIAGIMAAKQTSARIPLCHPLMLTSVRVSFEPVRNPDAHPAQSRFGIAVEATARLTGKTGVEMEALTAASVSSLTIYDMCKAIDREMMINQVRLEHKSGGASGTFSRNEGDKHGA